jgi:uncharacterized protein YciI
MAMFPLCEDAIQIVEQSIPLLSTWMQWDIGRFRGEDIPQTGNAAMIHESRRSEMEDGMAKFLVLTTFTSQEKRSAHRAEHRVHLNNLVDQGKLIFAGPFDDESGGLIIFEAVSEKEVREMMDEDPFSREGVFDTVEIKGWTQVAGR